MAAARSEKTFAGLTTRGFSLVELLFVVAIFSVLLGGLFLSGGGLARRFLVPDLDERVAGEVARATAWLDDAIYRATVAEKNFEIIVSRRASDVLTVRWLDGDKREEWRGERIRLQVYSAAWNSPTVFRYDWRAQTLTPALTLFVFEQKDSYTTAAGWFIMVSGHGLTRASRDAR